MLLDYLAKLADLREHTVSYRTRSAELWTVPRCLNNYSTQSLKHTLSTTQNAVLNKQQRFGYRVRKEHRNYQKAVYLVSTLLSCYAVAMCNLVLYVPYETTREQGASVKLLYSFFPVRPPFV